MSAPPIPDVILEGQRNDQLASAAGTMRHAGAHEEAIAAALLIMNAERCRPPLDEREVRKIAASVAQYPTGPLPRVSLTVSILNLATTLGMDLFHDADGGVYATLPLVGHLETHSLRSRGFRDWLAARTFEEHQKVPSDAQLNDVIGVLSHRARTGPERPAPVRIAAHGGKLYLDLGDATWRAVEIDAKGWRVVEQPPVRFQRSRLTLPLPVPVTGGSLDELWRFINVAEADRPLYLAFLLFAYTPTGPYPILDVVGSPGSAKTSAAEYTKQLVDPAEPLTRAQPRSEEDLLIAARRSQLIVFDNLSWAPEWLVDALCRLATGAGLGKRQKYTDDDEVILKATRPVVLTSLGNVATRADLLDRSIVLDLPMLPKAGRRTKANLNRRFAKAHPRLLGALLNAVSVGLRRLPATKLDEYPRMADFARWAVACESALPWKPGTFLKRYAANQAGRQKTALESNLFIPYLAGLVRKNGGEWRGTMTELLRDLNARAEKQKYGITRRKAWPQSSRALSTRLSELQQALEEQRSLGLRWGHSGSKRWVKITLDEPSA